MHEKSDMILVQSQKYALTCKMLHNDPHQWSKLLKELSKMKNFINGIFVVTFDEGFVVLHIQVLALKPLFSNVWYPYGYC